MSQLFNTPNQWLRDSLERADFSANALSRQLNLSAPQISRWVNDREKIPSHHLREIAVILFPQDKEYVDNLKACEEHEEQLYKTAKIFSCEEPGLADFIVLRMQEKLATVLTGELEATPRHHAMLGVRFLIAAQFAIRCAIALRESPLDALVTPENIQRHIQYPYNHFLGLLIDLGKDPQCLPLWRPPLLEFRQKAVRSLRQIARVADAPSDAHSLFIRHHAYHLLARHGDKSDMESISNRLRKDQLSLAPMERRLSLAGLSLAGHADVSAKYLEEIRSSDQMRVTNILFDAIHYGDISLDSAHASGLPRSAPLSATAHVMRHIVNVEHYGTIHAVEEQTMCDIFARYGEAPFRHPTILAHLRNSVQAPNRQLMSAQFRHFAEQVCVSNSAATTTTPSNAALLEMGNDN